MGVRIAPQNLWTMALDGKHGIGRSWEVLNDFRNLGCDVIGVQETRRSGQLIFVEAGYNVYCGGESGDEDGRNGQSGVGIAVKQALGTQTQ